jgi:hypothetical protein
MSNAGVDQLPLSTQECLFALDAENDRMRI